VVIEKFEDTNGVIRSRKSKKDKQYNGPQYLDVSSSEIIEKNLYKIGILYINKLK